MRITGSGRSSGFARRPAFTLVELLMVIVIIALLAGLLVSAVGAAVRASRNASVSAEINILGQALADFKSKYGDYPPSRVLLSERGVYAVDATTNGYATGSVDLTDGQLAARSVSWLRRLWPRMPLAIGTSASSASAPAISGPLGYYDWNHNGTVDPPYVLSGDECLVFFLGGIPTLVAATGGKPAYGTEGFNRDPANPSLATTVVVGPRTYSFTSRIPPLMEFKPGRLVDLDGDGMPSYFDPLGTARAYAYFSAYGGGGYDPNDCDFPAEADDGGRSPVALKFAVGFPVSTGGRVATSASPNPYTVSSTVPTSGNVAYHSQNTYQIISAGYDSLYGIGGQYDQGGSQALPVDTSNTLPGGSGQQLRERERDNLTSFSTSKLD